MSQPQRPLPPPTTPPPAQVSAHRVVPPTAMPPRHHRIRWTVLSLSVVILLIVVTGGWLAYRAISVINTKKIDGSKLSFFQQLSHIVTSSNDKLQGEENDRVNILLLGYGGPGHDGPYLTDTMMVASFQPSSDKLALISIPRDLVVDIPGYDFRKINNVLSFGRDMKYPGGGEAFAVKVVSDTLGIPIQYYARIDFTGFKDVIDRIGGVDVTVETAFSDYQYPDSGIGYEPIKFVAGQQTMNGDRALKFARSRKGNNGEGSDFARAKRQQKIIVALKEKLLSFGTLSNPKKISDILGSLGSHSQTNMEVWEMLRLSKLAGDLQADHIINKVLDDSTYGFLRAATGAGGAFILVPRDVDYSDIQFMSQNIFPIAAAEAEHAVVMVVNATSFSTLGTNTARGLEAMGLPIIKTSSISTTVGQTVLVATQPGKFRATENLLSTYAHAIGTLQAADWQRQTNDTLISAALSTPISTTVNGSIITNGRTINTNSIQQVVPDLILVLGQDQPKPSTSTSPAVATPTSTNTNSATNTNTKTTNSNTKASNTNSTNTNTGTTNATTTNTNTKASNTNNATTNTSLKNTNSAQ